MYTGTPGLVWTPPASIESLQTQNVQFINKLAQITAIQKEVDALEKDYEAIPATTTEKVEMMLSDNIDQVKLRNELLNIASRSGVSISEIAISEASNNADVGAYNVTFSFQAKYTVFKEVMANFEKNLRFYNIQTVSIRRQAGVLVKDTNSLIDKEKLGITVMFSVYYLK